MSRRERIKYPRSVIADCCDMLFHFPSAGQETSPEAKRFDLQ
jgi:hypothetical protein